MELRIIGVLRAEEMPRFRTQTAAMLLGNAARSVFCSDLRKLDVIDADTFSRLVAMLKTDNPAVERNALVAGDSSATALQMGRLVMEAGSPGRRVFRQVEPAVQWLGEVLTADEVTRLRAFLAEDV